MRLSIGLAGWQVHQLVREARVVRQQGRSRCGTVGLTSVFVRLPCAEKGSSSRHLTFGSFCQEKERSPAGKATMIKAPKSE